MIAASVTKLAEILIVNVVLSGDNALVIAMTALRLPPRHRRLAIGVGTGLSILIRIWLTITASTLVRLPYLQAAGGVLLAYLAIGLLLRRPGERGNRRTDFRGEDAPPTTGKKMRLRRFSGTEGDGPPIRLGEAVAAIVFADAVMSLDNVVALAGIAAGNELLLVIGLLVSVTLIMFASAVIAEMLDRRRLLVYIGAAVLAFVAGGMVAHDPALRDWPYGLPLAAAAGLVGAVYVLIYCVARVLRTSG
ncbi:MAG: YjbE family putative metal transport protein [Bacilli bacterium]